MRAWERTRQAKRHTQRRRVARAQHVAHRTQRRPVEADGHLTRGARGSALAAALEEERRCARRARTTVATAPTVATCASCFPAWMRPTSIPSPVIVACAGARVGAQRGAPRGTGTPRRGAAPWLGGAGRRRRRRRRTNSATSSRSSSLRCCGAFRRGGRTAASRASGKRQPCTVALPPPAARLRRARERTHRSVRQLQCGQREEESQHGALRGGSGRAGARRRSRGAQRAVRAVRASWLPRYRYQSCFNTPYASHNTQFRWTIGYGAGFSVPSEPSRLAARTSLSGDRNMMLPRTAPTAGASVVAIGDEAPPQTIGRRVRDAHSCGCTLGRRAAAAARRRRQAAQSSQA